LPREKKTPYESLLDQIKIISGKSAVDYIKILETARLGLRQEDLAYDSHTLLKLSYLNYYLGVFLPIAAYGKEKGKFDKIIFIDAFGGGGILGIKGTGYSVLGSTLLAATARTRNASFDEIISIDLDNKRSDLLQKRCNVLGLSNVKVLNGNVNDLITEVPNKFGISSKSIVMLFIDPEGMEPEFSKFVSLSQTTQYIDIMLNYTFGVRRLNGRIHYNNKSKDIEKMRIMIPNYVQGSDPDDRLATYFESQFGKPKSKKVEIRNNGRTMYSIILRVRQTYGDSKWIEAMNKFGDYISKTDGSNALQMLMTVMGDQGTLPL